MSKQSQLREYQTSILERLENAKKAGAEAPAGYLGVVIGTKNVLVNLQEISETSADYGYSPHPDCKTLVFGGCKRTRCLVYAINDIGQMLESTFTSISSSARLLLLSQSVTSNVAFVVEKMIGLRKLEEMKLREDVIEDEICLKSQTYQDDENRIWYMLDCDKLIRSKEFATPYMI